MADASERESQPRSTVNDNEPQPRSLSLLFRLALVPVVMLVITVLGFTASLFGDPNAPVQRWLLNSVGWILATEVTASLLLGLMAMADDRRQMIEARNNPKGAGKTAHASGVTDPLLNDSAPKNNFCDQASRAQTATESD